jgi:hypothetical protein
MMTGFFNLKSLCESKARFSSFSPHRAIRLWPFSWV